MTLPFWVSLSIFLLAIIIGLIIGIFGVGGGFLLIPALMIVFGVSGPVAVGTSLATIFINSSYGLFKRRKSGTVDLKMALIIGCGSIAGVFGGALILEKLKALPELEINGNRIQLVQFILLCCFFFLLAYIALFMAFDYIKSRHKTEEQISGFFHSIKIPPYAVFSSLAGKAISIPVLLFLGLMTGFITGLLGISGGVILIPALIHFTGLKGRDAAGTSLMLVWISSLTALFHNISGGNINWYLCLVLTAGGFCGTYAGTRIGLKLSSNRLKLYFILIISAAFLLTGYKITMLIF